MKPLLRLVGPGGAVVLAASGLTGALLAVHGWAGWQASALPGPIGGRQRSDSRPARYLPVPRPVQQRAPPARLARPRQLAHRGQPARAYQSSPESMASQAARVTTQVASGFSSSRLLSATTLATPITTSATTD
jgi:hypothetical protein